MLIFTNIMVQLQRKNRSSYSVNVTVIGIYFCDLLIVNLKLTKLSKSDAICVQYFLPN